MRDGRGAYKSIQNFILTISRDTRSTEYTKEAKKSTTNIIMNLASIRSRYTHPGINKIWYIISVTKPCAFDLNLFRLVTYGQCKINALWLNLLFGLSNWPQRSVNQCLIWNNWVNAERNTASYLQIIHKIGQESKEKRSGFKEKWDIPFWSRFMAWNVQLGICAPQSNKIHA